MTQNLTRVQRGAWAALLLMGALQAWVFRHVVSPDGVAYLDLSDAIMTARLSELVNGYWSPLYPTLVGVLRLAVSPTPLADPYWEFALLHVVSFIGFALSLAAFEWFVRALDEAGARWGQQPFATPLGLGVAYLCFAVTSLGMISVAGTVPDLFLAAAMFAAFACVLRLSEEPADRAAATRLGLALALGALTKSVAFPLGVIVLATLAFAIWRRGGRAAVLRAGAVFVIATLPWSVALSLTLGRPTVGDTGALNYAWYVNDQQPPNTGALPALANPQASLPLTGLAILPDARGTNPLWYDPARWHRDVRPRFSASQQWSRVSRSLRYYIYLGAPVLLAMVAIGAAARWRDFAVTSQRAFPVLLPCVAALGAYALVYTTSRLLAPFIPAACLMLAASFPRDATLRASRFSAAFGLSLLAIEALAPMRSMVMITYGLALFMIGWISLTNRPAPMRWIGSVAAVLLVWVVPLLPLPVARSVPIALGLAMWSVMTRASNEPGAHSFPLAVRRALAIGAVVACTVPGLGFGVVAVQRWITTPGSNVHPEWSSAQRLIREGVPRGSQIAILGNPESSGWARLARYQIVAVVPDDQVQAFLGLNDTERARVMSVFAQAGATRLVRRPGR